MIQNPLQMTSFFSQLQVLKRNNQKPLFEALQKIKEGSPYEFMFTLNETESK